MQSSKDGSQITQSVSYGNELTNFLYLYDHLNDLIYKVNENIDRFKHKKNKFHEELEKKITHQKYDLHHLIKKLISQNEDYAAYLSDVCNKIYIYQNTPGLSSLVSILKEKLYLALTSLNADLASVGMLNSNIITIKKILRKKDTLDNHQHLKDTLLYKGDDNEIKNNIRQHQLKQEKMLAETLQLNNVMAHLTLTRSFDIYHLIFKHYQSLLHQHNILSFLENQIKDGQKMIADIESKQNALVLKTEERIKAKSKIIQFEKNLNESTVLSDFNDLIGHFPSDAFLLLNNSTDSLLLFEKLYMAICKDSNSYASQRNALIKTLNQQLEKFLEHAFWSEYPKNKVIINLFKMNDNYSISLSDKLKTYLTELLVFNKNSFHIDEIIFCVDNNLNVNDKIITMLSETPENKVKNMRWRDVIDLIDIIEKITIATDNRLDQLMSSLLERKALIKEHTSVTFIKLSTKQFNTAENIPQIMNIFTKIKYFIHTSDTLQMFSSLFSRLKEIYENMKNIQKTKGIASMPKINIKPLLEQFNELMFYAVRDPKLFGNDLEIFYTSLLIILEKTYKLNLILDPQLKNYIEDLLNMNIDLWIKFPHSYEGLLSCTSMGINIIPFITQISNKKLNNDIVKLGILISACQVHDIQMTLNNKNCFIPQEFIQTIFAKIQHVLSSGNSNKNSLSLLATKHILEASIYYQYHFSSHVKDKLIDVFKSLKTNTLSSDQKKIFKRLTLDPDVCSNYKINLEEPVGDCYDADILLTNLNTHNKIDIEVDGPFHYYLDADLTFSKQLNIQSIVRDHTLLSINITTIRCPYFETVDAALEKIKNHLVKIQPKMLVKSASDPLPRSNFHLKSWFNNKNDTSHIKPVTPTIKEKEKLPNSPSLLKTKSLNPNAIHFYPSLLFNHPLSNQEMDIPKTFIMKK